jgi:DNA-binding CsgD family transcriptional regulator
VRNKVNDYLRQKYRDRRLRLAIQEQEKELDVQRDALVPGISTLSAAEFQVFRLLGLGLTNTEIGKQLFRSPLTVRSHLKKIYAKCGVPDRLKLGILSYKTCHQEWRTA